jgi:hypothetical protein
LNLERAQAMLDAWRESGQSRADYAASVGVGLKTFDRWRRRVEGISPKVGAGLARVVAGPGAADVDSPSEVRVIPGNPPAVVLPRNWEAALLQRVLEACRC